MKTIKRTIRHNRRNLPALFARDGKDSFLANVGGHKMSIYPVRGGLGGYRVQSLSIGHCTAVGATAKKAFANFMRDHRYTF